MHEVIMRYHGSGEDSHGLERVGELVRCKECYWWIKQKNSLKGRCDLTGMYSTGSWYCANGRRRHDSD